MGGDIFDSIEFVQNIRDHTNMCVTVADAGYSIVLG